MSLSNARNNDGEIIDNDNNNKRSHGGAKKTPSGDRIIDHGDGITERIGGGSGSTSPANATS